MSINQGKKKQAELEFLESVGNELDLIRSNLQFSQMYIVKEMRRRGLEHFSRGHLIDIEKGLANITLYETVLLCTIYKTSIESLLKSFTGYKIKYIPPYQRTDVNKLDIVTLKKKTVQLDKQLETIYNLYRN